MKFSYSRVECFANCPYQYKLRYIDKLKTLPDQQADNALYLGTALHLGLETGSVEQAVENYKSNYNLIDDANINEIIKLEYVLPKALELLPDGLCEVEIKTDEFIGFIDRLCPTYVDGDGIQHWDLYDYKYCTNEGRYKTSKQLHVYKHYYELTNPGNVIDHLYYLIIKKVGIRQRFKAKPPETLNEFRNRLMEYLEATQIFLMEVKFEEQSITHFQECCQYLKGVKEFPKNQTKLCDWCAYKEYCRSNGKIHWEITNDYWEDSMVLPENKKKDLKKEKLTEIPSMYLYADSYIGKSTFFDSFDNVLFLNSDGNYDMYFSPSIYIAKTVKMNGRMSITTSAWENFLEVISELEKKENTFKHIVLDLVEDFREHCRVYMCDKLKISHESDSAYSKGWDMVTTEFNQAIKRLKAAGYYVHYCSKELTKEVNPKNGMSYTVYKPNIQDKTASMLSGTVKLTCRAYVDDKGERWINLNPNVHEFGGGRYLFKVDKCKLNKDELLKAINEADLKPVNK